MKKPKLNKKLKRPGAARKFKRPSLKRLPRLQRAKPTEEKVSEALSTVPRITNETVGEHREEVLSSARKYIYPLQHSKHSVVRVSLGLLLAVLVAFFAFCGLELYKFQATSGFIYDVTKVVPFPVAKTGKSWISYESYLFELRRNMHYYHTQQEANFSTTDGKAQLRHLKQQAMNQVIQDAYVKQLATTHHIKVSGQAVNDEVTLLRSENRLGNSDQVFQDVLNKFWGWSEADFKRELQQQLLQEAVVAKLDTATTAKAASTLQQLATGADFGTLAKQYSDDAATSGNDGQYAAAITPNDPNVPPAITAELFRLKPGQVSGLINTGYGLDIVKVIDATGGSLHAAHIQFTFTPITTYTKPLETKLPPHQYIKI